MIRILKNWCLVLISLVILGQLTAQDKSLAKLDSLFSHIESNNQGMGSLSLFKAGKPYYERAIGYADVSQELRATPDHKYKIGSVSKMFTATMIMQLVEEGMLRLDDRLYEFYPEIKNAELITISMLLQHRSGIEEYLKDVQPIQLANPISRQQLLTRIKQGSAQFKPDSKYVYSNSNYALLAWILEDITNQSYAELLAEHITTPLGLASVMVGNRKSGDQNFAYSYLKTEQWDLSVPWDMSWAFGAGEISATPSDVNIFLNALYNGKILRMESVQQMKDMNEGYGLGMFAVPFSTSYGYGHNGRIEDFSTSAYYFEDFDLSLCYISNGEVMPTNEILIAVLSLANGLPYEFPEFKEKKAIAVSVETLETYVGNYISATFPLDVKIFVEGTSLMAQATGQGSFTLTAVGDGEFVFVSAGIEMTFDVDSGSMTLKQAGMTNVFKKE